ncbi:MAG: hypothetical protein ABIR96_07415 [Bdellovibrionota bacterium]
MEASHYELKKMLYSKLMTKTFGFSLLAATLLLSVSSQAAEHAASCYSDLREQMFADDGVMDVRLVMGYLDAVGSERSDANQPNKASGRNEEIESYQSELIKEGFTLVSSKQIQNEMKVPDGQGFVYEKKDVRGRPIRISIVSATKADEKYNFFASKKAEAFFDSALREADAVIYSGHSRKGGGPDMRKPVTHKDAAGDLHVDYAHYQKTRPGLARIENNLAKTQDKPELVASLSCDSYNHFYDFLKKQLQCESQSTGLVLSTRVAYADETEAAALAIIRSLVSGKDMTAELGKTKACGAAGMFGDPTRIPFRFDIVKPATKSH